MLLQCVTDDDDKQAMMALQTSSDEWEGTRTFATKEHHTGPEEDSTHLHMADHTYK